MKWENSSEKQHILRRETPTRKAVEEKQRGRVTWKQREEGVF